MPSLAQHFIILVQKLINGKNVNADKKQKHLTHWQQLPTQNVQFDFRLVQKLINDKWELCYERCIKTTTATKMR